MELATEELQAVVGGSVELSVDVCVAVRATVLCLPTHDCTGYYPSINAPCTTPVTPVINWPDTVTCR